MNFCSNIKIVLDIADMGNAFLNAYTILKKCFTGKEDTSIIEIDVTMSTDFLIFANNGFGNCYLWESLFGDNFHKQVVGYSSTAYFLFQKYIFDKKYSRYETNRLKLGMCDRNKFNIIKTFGSVKRDNYL